MKTKLEKCVVLGTLAAVAPLFEAVDASDVPGAARAIRIRQEIVDSRFSPPSTEIMMTTLGGDAYRLDTEFQENGEPLVSTIFRVEEDHFLMLFHETEEASIQDREQLRIIGERRRLLERRLEERMAADPTIEDSPHARMLERRKETARRQAEKDLQAEPPGSGFEKVDEEGTLLGLPWIKYRRVRSGSSVQELLITPWSELGIGDDAARVFERMTRFVEDATEIAGGIRPTENPYAQYLAIGGFPLVNRYIDREGQVMLETRVVSIDYVPERGVFENPGYPEQGIAENLPELE